MFVFRRVRSHNVFHPTRSKFRVSIYPFLRRASCMGFADRSRNSYRIAQSIRGWLASLGWRKGGLKRN